MKWFDRKMQEFITAIRDSDRKPISVGDDLKNPTYWRWFVWPRNRFLNLYLHNFLQDDAHDLHDHRMINISFILQGSYFEERFIRKPVLKQRLPPTNRRLRPQYSLTFRLPATPHRVVLLRDAEGRPIPSWSLFLGFPQWRNWGFWCPGTLPAFNVRTREQYSTGAHWRPHEKYAMSADPTGRDYGRKGAGCGE